MAASSVFHHELKLLPTSLGEFAGSAGGPDPGSFQITASAAGPRECESWCVPFKSRLSVSYCPPGLPYASPESLQSRMPWGPLVQDPQAGQPDVGPRPLRPWETLCSGDYSVLVYLPMEVRLNSITSPALLFVLLWFFLYIFRCGQSLLLIFRLFS